MNSVHHLEVYNEDAQLWLSNNNNNTNINNANHMKCKN